MARHAEAFPCSPLGSAHTCACAHTSTSLTIQEIEGSRPKPCQCPVTAAPDNLSNGKLETSPAGIRSHRKPDSSCWPIFYNRTHIHKECQDRNTRGLKKTEAEGLFPRKRMIPRSLEGGLMIVQEIW